MHHYLTAMPQIGDFKSALNRYNPMLLCDIEEAWDESVKPWSFIEKIYHFYNREPTHCEFGTRKRFYGWNFGYRCRRKCQCTHNRTMENNRNAWGTDYPMQSKKGKQEYTEAYRLKTGYDFPFQNPETQKLAQATNSDPERIARASAKRSATIRSKNPEWYDYNNIYTLLKRYTRKEVADKLGCSIPYIDKVIGKQEWTEFRDDPSYYEVAISRLIEDLDIEYQEKVYGIIGRKQLDHYIPSHNLAIEFNGVRWHGENINDRGKDYHIGKTTACLDLGIHLLHIFHDEWDYHPEAARALIKRNLNGLETLDASCLEIIEIPEDMCSDFVDENSIMAFIPGDVHYAACYNDEIYATASLDENIIRNFAVSNQYSISGIHKILFDRIKQEFGDTVYYESDRGIDRDTEYVPYQLIDQTSSEFKYADNHVRYNRNSLLEVLQEKPDGVSEREFMIQQGYNRVWNCGKNIWRI